jgi:hypothetical protein
LRQYATSQKVVGSILDEVIGFSVGLILPTVLWALGLTVTVPEIFLEGRR